MNQPDWLIALSVLFTFASLVSAATPSTTGASVRAPLSPPSESLIAAALTSNGNADRLHRVFQKAKRGEPIVLGVFGGSITAGAKASTPAHRYANLVRDWLANQFPNTTVTLVNAGIGATGSPYGCLRAERDLLVHHPDIVIVDFGVNDGTEPWMADTYEGVLRQILRQDNSPAILQIFFMHQNGANAQTLQQALGEHYGLPMVSYRDALWPQIAAGHFAWDDVSPDDVHPNDWGHAFAATCLERELETALRSTAAVDVSAPNVPPPLFTDTFAHTLLIDRDDLKSAATDGWIYDHAAQCLTSHTPGSAITFEVSGTAIFTQFFRLRGGFGRAQLQVDAGTPIVLDGWFSGTWGGYIDTNVARDLKPGKHTIRIELLDQKDGLSTGHEFHIIGIGAAGVP
jgi:lysophospholipase L1-like esterase